MWEGPAHCRWHCSWVDGPGCTGKQTMRSRPVSRTPPWPLLQLQTLGSCPDFFWQSLWCGNVNKTNPTLSWSRCFITAGLREQEAKYNSVTIWGKKGGPGNVAKMAGNSDAGSRDHAWVSQDRPSWTNGIQMLWTRQKNAKARTNGHSRRGQNKHEEPHQDHLRQGVKMKRNTFTKADPSEKHQLSPAGQSQPSRARRATAWNWQKTKTISRWTQTIAVLDQENTHISWGRARQRSRAIKGSWC